MKLRIKVEGQSYDVEVEVLPESAADPLEIAPPVEIPASVLQPPPKSDIRPEDKVCRSPIAGIVVSVSAALRQPIRQDEPVLIIEAMKMQTAIGAPMDGVVDAVHVKPGELVKPGQPLCTLI